MARVVRPYPAGTRWAGVCPTLASRHTGLAMARRSGYRYIHRVRGIWLAWNTDRTAATFVAGWECSGDGSSRVDLIPIGTEPTCPICIVNQRVEDGGVAPGDAAIYYARKDDLVKIGSSRNVGRRLGGLGAELIVAEPVTLSVSEFGRHEQFNHLRSHGEWFRPAPDLLAHIESLKVAS